MHRNLAIKIAFACKDYFLHTWLREMVTELTVYAMYTLQVYILVQVCVTQSYSEIAVPERRHLWNYSRSKIVVELCGWNKLMIKLKKINLRTKCLTTTNLYTKNAPKAVNQTCLVIHVVIRWFWTTKALQNHPRYKFVEAERLVV